MERNQVAHDLAILYMQLEIKEGRIRADLLDDFSGFANEYQNLYQQFSQLVDK